MSTPSFANKSKETAFYFQDDWKVTPKLTLNLGLRYEWSTPYKERNNQIQFSNFTGDSGISVPYNVSAPNPGMASAGRTGDLPGTTVFAGAGRRNLPVDRNNWAPRLGFAYAFEPKDGCPWGRWDLLRPERGNKFSISGHGVRQHQKIQFTKDDFQTRQATLANPFTLGYAAPPGKAAGPLGLYGLKTTALGYDSRPQRRDLPVESWRATFVPGTYHHRR